VYTLCHVPQSLVLWQKAAPGYWVWHRSVPAGLWLLVGERAITAALIQSNPPRAKRPETFFSIN